MTTVFRRNCAVSFSSAPTEKKTVSLCSDLSFGLFVPCIDAFYTLRTDNVADWLQKLGKMKPNKLFIELKILTGLLFFAAFV